MTSLMLSYLTLVIVGLTLVASQVTGPNFCFYVDGEFECSYVNMVTSADRPINYTRFSIPPQRIKIFVNGFIPFFGDTQVFTSEFASIVTTGFDPNFPATLTIDCGFGGSMFMSAGSFYNMSYIQHLKIKNCNVYNIPSTAFEGLVNLDYFGFENGLIDSVDPNGMANLNVEQLNNDYHRFPRPVGRFEIRNSRLTNKYVPFGLLYSWKNLTEAILVGADIETLTSDVFRYNTRLRIIDLSDNPFTSLPDGIFGYHSNLAEVRLNNINWTCSCDNTWIIPFAADNDVKLVGDFVCQSGNGMTLHKYYYDSCVNKDLCNGTPGLVLMSHCYTLFDLLCYSLAFAAFIVLIVCLALIIHAKRNAQGNAAKKTRAKGKWNKVINKAKLMKKVLKKK